MRGNFTIPTELGYCNCMAQKPVANAFTLELEPVVLQELRRHLDTEDIWYAHDYVPFDKGAAWLLSAEDHRKG